MKTAIVASADETVRATAARFQAALDDSFERIENRGGKVLRVEHAASFSSGLFCMTALVLWEPTVENLLAEPAVEKLLTERGPVGAES